VKAISDHSIMPREVRSANKDKKLDELGRLTNKALTCSL